MNDMTPLPRHRQAPISFRSDIAARLLSQLTRDGRSQAQVIEEALEQAMAARPRLTIEERNARIDAIVRRGHALTGPTRQEVEAEMYDEFGAPR